MEDRMEDGYEIGGTKYRMYFGILLHNVHHPEVIYKYLTSLNPLWREKRSPSDVTVKQQIKSVNSEFKD